MAPVLLGSPWIVDGVTEGEAEVIADLAEMADDEPEIASSVMTVPDKTGELIRATLGSLRSILTRDRSRLEELKSRPWFQDGLTDEEAALAVVLKEHDVFHALIEDGHVISGTVTLPLAGEVALYAVSHSATRKELQLTVELLRTGTRAMEDFMGTPWNSPNVIVLVAEIAHDARDTGEIVQETVGYYATSHIRLSFMTEGLFYHELGHYYFSGLMPVWLVEGGAEFIKGYVLGNTNGGPGYDPLERFYSIEPFGCHAEGMWNIQEWISKGHTPFGCAYSLGEAFLLGMYISLGHGTVTASLRQLYELAEFKEHVTEDDVYRTFLSNTPSAKQDEFRGGYTCLHGRPIPGYTPAATAIDPQDRDALAAFYHATNGQGWKNNENWLSEAPVRQWRGVVADCDGRVVGLALKDNDLSGEIPAELGNLSNLRNLILENNSLAGPIPVELGNLSELRRLGLRGDDLSGEIPAELGNLSNLRIVFLENNSLAGPIPAELGRLSNLESLVLHRNQLSGEMPPELGNLSELRALRLAGNQLSGPIPAELGNLSELRTLSLGQFLGVRNQLSGEIPAELGSLSNLKSLGLEGNQLSGPIPAELGNLSNLRLLHLWGNQLTGSIPSWLGSLSNLESLSLGGNQLTGPIPAELGSLSSLSGLLLEGNQLSGPIPAELGNLSELTWLDLQSNDLSGPIPAELGNLSNLEILYLMGNQLSGPIPSELGNMSSLRDLFLHNNFLAGPIPLELGRLSNLRQLGLGANQLTGPIPVDLGSLSNLAYLDLGGNQLSGPIPAELGNLSNLGWLILWGNQLSGEIPAELGSLSNLQRLLLRGNQLTGCIPQGLKDVEDNDFASSALPFC